MDEITAVDVYNMTITGGVCMTISGAASDSHHIPTVIIRKSPPPYCIDQGAGKSKCNIYYDEAPTLTTTHYGTPVVLTEKRDNDRADSIYN